VVLSAMAHAARRQKVLLEHTRSGLAHQDLSRPEQASDLAALLDSHSRARSRTASLLQTYIDYNFGAPDPLRGPQRLAFAWLLPVLQVLFRWRPGLALLLLHYERQTGLSFLEELAATAHRGSRPGLAELATAVHDELSQQASGMYSLLSALPLQTGPERLAGRLVVMLWWGACVLPHSSLLEPASRRAYRTIGFDAGVRFRVLRRQRRLLTDRFTLAAGVRTDG